MADPEDLPPPPPSPSPSPAPPLCGLCGKPLEKGEESVCSDRAGCSERQRFWRTEEGM
jgi:hypothetical protein